MGCLLQPSTTVLPESGRITPFSFVITQPDGFESTQFPGQTFSVELVASSCAKEVPISNKTKQMLQNIFFIILSVISQMKGIDKFQRTVFSTDHCQNFQSIEDCKCVPWLRRPRRLFLRLRIRTQK
ncbi:MAG: hypothetical protein CVU60_11220 [Deltaproteobacteria bacterium HGW-Deltaproteobacteria-18]|nr:MAG: hypothetical protein CVU60_11220 [Deltaproteobacteria bacterium HGW-Deltaproteobacteria-18]